MAYELIEDYASQIYVRQKQFEQYLISVIDLAKLLNVEYNNFLQQLFNVKLYTLLTEGEQYINDVIAALNKTEKSTDLPLFLRLRQGIEDIKKQFTEEEFYYLEYRRHNVCHMFKKGYDLIKDSGQIREKRQVATKDGQKKDIPYNQLIDSLKEIILKYGEGNPRIGDENFDKAKIKQIYPIIEELRQDVNNIQINKFLAQLAAL